MCGIVAYLGPKEAQAILVNGLRRLEYRGYDSSGICILENDALNSAKAKGKLSELEAELKEKPLSGFSGIGHTRWATHGAPSVQNAHPHLSNVTLVTLPSFTMASSRTMQPCEKLTEEGATFESETDTEVIVHLLAKLYNGSLKEAMADAMGILEGAFGIVAMTSHEPGVLIGARRGSPLVLGVGENEFFLASDAAAIVEHTPKLFT